MMPLKQIKILKRSNAKLQDRVTQLVEIVDDIYKDEVLFLQEKIESMRQELCNRCTDSTTYDKNYCKVCEHKEATKWE